MPQTPPTGDRQFRNQLVRISDLTVNTTVIEGLEFSNCRIVGPAILIPLGQTNIVHSRWGGALDAVFWEITPGRDHVIGAVGIVDCTFSNCAFSDIGFAGPAEFRQLMEGGTRE